MRKRLVGIILGISAVVPLSAQTTIDGHTAFYDSRTGTYLVSSYDALSSIPEGLTVATTTLPIIQLTGTFSKSYENGTAYLAEADGTENSYNMKAKYRGASTNTDDKHKRNFHIKFLDKSGDKKNVALLGLRKDNSYLLDAGQIDLGRIRNHVAQEIWRDIDSKPYYADSEEEAKTYIGCEFVEVFINDEYFGLYSLTEDIDRKQLQIVKYDDDNEAFHGMLYKGETWTYTGMWGPFEAPDATAETWGGFTVEYPEIDDVCPTNWETLYNACLFADASSDEVFADSVAEYFDLPVLVDMYLFHNVLGASDHGGKNMFWACYDVQQSPKLTPVPWDYDTTIGQEWNNAAVHSDDDGPTTGDLWTYANPQPIYRLLALDADDILTTVVERYQQLRETVFNTDSLTTRYNDYFDMLRAAGTLDRETQRWSGDTDIAEGTLDFDDEQEYIDTWLRQRLEYLDNLFTQAVTAIADLPAHRTTLMEGHYNLAGQRVADTYKGITITAGKKHLPH